VNASAVPITSVTSSVRGVSVELRGVAHRYGARLALEPQTFELSGGLTAVTGSNGSGKSTLLRILAGLLRPTQGTVQFRVDGRELSPVQRRPYVGLATPELSFYEEMTAFENLAFAAEARAMKRPAAAARGALERIGLAARADDRISELSSGMRQRVRLAFASLGDPPLLLLDEPGSHLDDEGRATLERWIALVAPNTLVVLATNDEREWRLAERRIQLRGRDLGHPA
jgi:ABC-type multidrug transport system ATPase subunit